MECAVKSDWKTIEMPPERDIFSLDMKLTEEEFFALKMGQVPQEMEDKWFSYFEDGTVNRNPEQYHETSLAQDKIGAKLRVNFLAGRKGNADLMRQYLKKEKRP